MNVGRNAFVRWCGLTVMLWGLGVACVSCNRVVVEGLVTDTKGDTLPGVAVSAPGGEYETLTNAVGRYALTCAPGVQGLDFIKNGYTSGHLQLEVLEPRSVSASTMSLWRLPPATGVYLLEDYRYRRLMPLEPKPFTLQGGGLAFGATSLPKLEDTPHQDPVIMCHRMRAYDGRLARLHTVKASAPGGSGVQDTWVSETTIPMEMVAIDEPERFLTQVRATEPLAPGVYAMHWGALEGRTAAGSEPRMFLFRVADAAHTQETVPSEQTPAPSATPNAEPAKAVQTTPVDTEAVDAEAEPM